MDSKRITFANFRYRERGNIEAQFFNIQTKLKSKGHKGYTPPEGKMLFDIEKAWNVLEKAEHDRELALREELIRWVDEIDPSMTRTTAAEVKLGAC